jgi:hypothetical protein
MARWTHVRAAVAFDNVVDALAFFTAIHPSFKRSSNFSSFFIPAFASVFLDTLVMIVSNVSILTTATRSAIVIVPLRILSGGISVIQNVALFLTLGRFFAIRFFFGIIAGFIRRRRRRRHFRRRRPGRPGRRFRRWRRRRRRWRRSAGRSGADHRSVLANAFLAIANDFLSGLVDFFRNSRFPGDRARTLRDWHTSSSVKSGSVGTEAPIDTRVRLTGFGSG